MILVSREACFLVVVLVTRACFRREGKDVTESMQGRTSRRAWMGYYDQGWSIMPKASKTILDCKPKQYFTDEWLEQYFSLKVCFQSRQPQWLLFQKSSKWDLYILMSVHRAHNVPILRVIETGHMDTKNCIKTVCYFDPTSEVWLRG